MSVPDASLDPALHWLTFGDVCRESARRYPKNTAVVCGELRYTYAELDVRVSRLANALRARGVAAGERVVWLGQNCHQVYELFLACSKIGAIVAPVNWRLAADEMAFILDDLDPVVAVWQEADLGDAIRAGRAKSTMRAQWVQGDDPGRDGYEAMLMAADATDDEQPISPTTPVMIIYTAAFGGRPNGALLHHLGLHSTAVFRAMVCEFSERTAYLNATNFYHVGNWDFGTLPTLLMGGKNVFLRKWTADEGAEIIERERVTIGFMPGPMYDGVCDAAKAAGRDISSLLPPSFNHDRVGGYGQTEVHGVQTFRFLGQGATGRNGRSSLFGQLRLLDNAGSEVPTGEVGEICFRGPIVMAGYHNRPELNAKVLEGGWRHSNDLGRREPDGSITFIGVKQRMLKSGAENIYPVEVETALKSHPAVRDAAVIGVPDERWDQNVMAILVLHPGTTATAEDVIEHCRTCMASYKKPKLVEFVDELPRRNGAVDYDALDQRFGGGGYPGF